jgi:hypothetical protein
MRPTHAGFALLVFSAINQHPARARYNAGRRGSASQLILMSQSLILSSDSLETDTDSSNSLPSATESGLSRFSNEMDQNSAFTGHALRSGQGQGLSAESYATKCLSYASKDLSSQADWPKGMRRWGASRAARAQMRRPEPWSARWGFRSCVRW